MVTVCTKCKNAELWTTTRMALGESWRILVTRFTKVLSNTAYTTVGALVPLGHGTLLEAVCKKVTWLLVRGTIRTSCEAIGQEPPAWVL